MDLTIQGLQNKYRSGELNVRSLIQKLNSDIKNAPKEIFITITPDEMLEKFISNLEQKTIDDLPLYGIPFVIKDNIDLAEVLTTAACPKYGYVAKSSATVVAKLIEAGAIPMGKSNMDQFATGLVGVRSPYGVVPNRIAPSYISGGSSSGSAASLAYELASFSLGTDTAGSGRVPAAFNKLVGLKPSKGLLSTKGVVPACRSLDCVSIFALNLDDAKSVFDIAQGVDELDEFSRVMPTSEVKSANLANLKIGIPNGENLKFFGNKEYEKAFNDSLQSIKNAGATIVEVDFTPFIEAAKLLYNGAWVFERYAAVGKFIEENQAEVLDVIKTIITPKDKMSAEEVFKCVYQLQKYKVLADKVLNSVDFIITPTAPTIYKAEEVLANPIELNSNLGTYTNYMNLLDCAGLAIPTKDAGKLPFGITLVGKAFSDYQLLAYAKELDKAMNDEVVVAVCGAHLKGCALHYELENLNAKFVQATYTAKEYGFYAFESNGISKPALLLGENSASCYVELYSLTKESFAKFVLNIPSPLGIGKVKLINGEMVSSFIGEAEIRKYGKDISDLADWRKYINQ